jgi:DNA-binding transcriptional LysR family regulator
MSCQQRVAKVRAVDATSRSCDKPTMVRAKKLDIEPAHMLVFAALARTGGVRSAANALGVPRSTVSRRLAQLEASIGAPLVVRNARRFTLTSLGREFFERCTALETLLRESEDLVRRAQDTPSGLLRIDAAPVIAEEVLPEVIVELARRYPRLAIEVRTAVDYIDLRRGNADVVLRARRLEDANDIYAIHLGTSITGCYASPSYLKQHGVPTTLAELSKHECILVGTHSPSTWIFATGTKPREATASDQPDECIISVSGRVRVDSFRIARSIAARGVGVLRTACVFAEPLVKAGDLVPVLERYWWRTPIYAAHAGPNPQTPKVREFLALVRAAARAALPEDGAARWLSV